MKNAFPCCVPTRIMFASFWLWSCMSVYTTVFIKHWLYVKNVCGLSASLVFVVRMANMAYSSASCARCLPTIILLYKQNTLAASIYSHEKCIWSRENINNINKELVCCHALELLSCAYEIDQTIEQNHRHCNIYIYIHGSWHPNINKIFYMRF